VPSELLVHCAQCGDEAPPGVARSFGDRLATVVSGDVLEAGENADPSRIWTMRVGGGAWGHAVCACPDHRIASGIVGRG
jgi:hypothetical protein